MDFVAVFCYNTWLIFTNSYGEVLLEASLNRGGFGGYGIAGAVRACRFA